MKKEVTKMQAKLDSAVPLDEHNDVENLSLHMKLLGEFSQPEHQALSLEASQETSIARLLNGQIALAGEDIELLH